jgi:hypothetical protein
MKNYVAAKDVAKLVRQDLKANFPDVKFSVRSDRCIRVSYDAEILSKDVQAVIAKYAGEGFDGMQDLRYSMGAFAVVDGVEMISMASFVFVNNENWEFEKASYNQPVWA